MFNRLTWPLGEINIQYAHFMKQELQPVVIFGADSSFDAFAFLTLASLDCPTAPAEQRLCYQQISTSNSRLQNWSVFLSIKSASFIQLLRLSLHECMHSFIRLLSLFFNQSAYVCASPSCFFAPCDLVRFFSLLFGLIWARLADWLAESVFAVSFVWSILFIRSCMHSFCSFLFSSLDWFFVHISVFDLQIHSVFFIRFCFVHRFVLVHLYDPYDCISISVVVKLTKGGRYHVCQSLNGEAADQFLHAGYVEIGSSIMIMGYEYVSDLRSYAFWR